MPSYTSSSDPYSHEDRPVPEIDWKKALLLGVALMILGTIAWEYNARVIWGYGPEAYIDSPGLWAKERRKIDRGEAEVVVIGSSRILFDFNLDVYEELTGVRPIQLAMVGTNPRPFLADLANDDDFKGLLVLGITPGSFFRETFGLYGDTPEYYQDESPSQWIGQQISMALEPRLSFYDNYTFPLFNLFEHAGLENREGVGPAGNPVWFIYETGPDRGSEMFWKVEELEYYRHYAQMVWKTGMQAADARGPAPFDLDAYLAGIVADIDKIRARGGDVVLLRTPSSGDYRPRELRLQPREDYWDRLLRDTNSVGVHFEDYPELQGFRIPEWSHLHSEDAPKFTAAFIPILDAKLKAAGKPGILPEGDNE